MKRFLYFSLSFLCFVSSIYAQPLYSIGSIGPAGGVIFFDKGYYSDGWQYLEAAPRDQHPGIVWRKLENFYSRNYNTNTGIGSGKNNTLSIIQNEGDGYYAAIICRNLEIGGYRDWYLPSSGELDLLYLNLAKNGIGNFILEKSSLVGYTKNWWWSSSLRDGSILFAYAQNFTPSSINGPGGTKKAQGVTVELRVRAIRSF
jgi:hypothetical protein